MKRQITTFAFLVLIVSMIAGSIPNYVFADSNSQTQIETMIEIAKKAAKELDKELSKTTDTSDDLQELFNKGLVEFELLKEAEDDFPTAKEHFLSAMKIFREISQKITEQSTQVAVKSATQSTPSSNELERLELYIDRLKGIAIKNKVNVDFSNIDELIKYTKEAQKDGNYDETKDSMAKIKSAIIELQKSIKEKTRTSTTERAKDFAKKHIAELDRLIAQAKEIGIPEDAMKSLVEAKEYLHEESDVEQIIKKVKHIILVKAQFEKTKIDRINSRIYQLETTFERLSNYADKDDSNLEKARTMLSELKNLVSEEKLSETISLINSLNNMLQYIESSQSAKQEASTAGNEGSPTSLDESKAERIKVKIERLENQLNQLADQIKENDAAKRWLENAKLQLKNAKSQVDDSPEEVLKIIMKIEQIIERIKNTIQ